MSGRITAQPQLAEAQAALEAEAPGVGLGPEVPTHPPSTREHQIRVTVGVVLDGRIQERWVLEALNQTLRPGVQLAVVAVIRGRIRRPLAVRLHRLFDRFDERLRCRKERLFAFVDVVSALGVPLLYLDVDVDPDGWMPGEGGVDALRDCQVDVWLCFTASLPRRPLPPVSRLGLWGLEIGRGISAASPWAGATEVGAGSPVTAVSVVDYTTTGTALHRSIGATVRNSARLNRLGCLRKGVSFFKRLVERLLRDEANWLRALPAPPVVPDSYPVSRVPALHALASLSWRVVSNVAANRARALNWRDQWQIAYYFLSDSKIRWQCDRLRYLVPPKDRFWADPIAVEHQGRYFIFFEELPFGTEKGRIMAVEVFEDGGAGKVQVVLERPYHLSYPFIFSWEDCLFLLPETAENETIEVYRCEAFPTSWRLHRVLLKGLRAYDATLWQGQDRWWMFVNVAEPGADSCDELHLYWSTSPLGTWVAHPRNPIVCDVRRARPAGPLFMRDGALHRPSQDCSIAYGHSVVISRVDVLSEDDYRETPVERVRAGWRKDILRVHTVGASNRLRVLDYLVSRRQRF